MYLIALAWLYVVLMMAITETSIIAGIMTLTFYGLAPLALWLWLFGIPERNRRRLRNAQNSVDAPDRGDAKPD